MNNQVFLRREAGASGEAGCPGLGSPFRLGFDLAGIGFVACAVVRAVETGPETTTFLSSDESESFRRPALTALEFDPGRVEIEAELPPERNTLRPGPNKARASGTCEPLLSMLCPVSVRTNGQRPGISFAGGVPSCLSAPSANTTARSTVP